MGTITVRVWDPTRQHPVPGAYVSAPAGGPVQAGDTGGADIQAPAGTYTLYACDEADMTTGSATVTVVDGQVAYCDIVLSGGPAATGVRVTVGDGTQNGLWVFCHQQCVDGHVIWKAYTCDSNGQVSFTGLDPFSEVDVAVVIGDSMAYALGNTVYAGRPGTPVAITAFPSPMCLTGEVDVTVGYDAEPVSSAAVICQCGPYNQGAGLTDAAGSVAFTKLPAGLPAFGLVYDVSVTAVNFQPVPPLPRPRISPPYRVAAVAVEMTPSGGPIGN